MLVPALIEMKDGDDALGPHRRYDLASSLPWAYPVIGENDAPEAVCELAAPAVDAGQLGDMLTFADCYVAQTGGRYPVTLTDLQRPLDTAYLVWGSSAFMVVMHTHPKEHPEIASTLR
jgi:hypothetical protein